LAGMSKRWVLLLKLCCGLATVQVRKHLMSAADARHSVYLRPAVGSSLGPPRALLAPSKLQLSTPATTLSLDARGLQKLVDYEAQSSTLSHIRSCSTHG
jgi:hypothetical protein